eukprot:6109632-Prymnesium_polylepis.3
MGPPGSHRGADPRLTARETTVGSLGLASLALPLPFRPVPSLPRARLLALGLRPSPSVSAPPFAPLHYPPPPRAVRWPQLVPWPAPVWRPRKCGLEVASSPPARRAPLRAPAAASLAARGIPLTVLDGPLRLHPLARQAVPPSVERSLKRSADVARGGAVERGAASSTWIS